MKCDSAYIKKALHDSEFSEGLLDFLTDESQAFPSTYEEDNIVLLKVLNNKEIQNKFLIERESFKDGDLGSMFCSFKTKFSLDFSDIASLLNMPVDLIRNFMNQEINIQQVGARNISFMLSFFSITVGVFRKYLYQSMELSTQNKLIYSNTAKFIGGTQKRKTRDFINNNKALKAESFLSDVRFELKNIGREDLV